jgi:hypothetical protein
MIIDKGLGIRRRFQGHLEIGLVNFRNGDALGSQLLKIILKVAPAAA